MMLKQILHILKHNQTADKWIREADDGLASGSRYYCVADVCLNSEFKIVWQDHKPCAAFRLLYCGVCIVQFEIPVSSVDAFSSKGFLAKHIVQSTLSIEGLNPLVTTTAEGLLKQSAEKVIPNFPPYYLLQTGNDVLCCSSDHIDLNPLCDHYVVATGTINVRVVPIGLPTTTIDCLEIDRVKLAGAS